MTDRSDKLGPESAVVTGRLIEIVVDGEILQVVEGQSLAAALWANGKRQLRRTPMGKPRGVFCGMGICFDCVMTVDGVPNVRACMTTVYDGLRAETQG